jgi:probable HAF family extracellular repeat protein
MRRVVVRTDPGSGTSPARLPSNASPKATGIDASGFFRKDLRRCRVHKSTVRGSLRRVEPTRFERATSTVPGNGCKHSENARNLREQRDYTLQTGDRNHLHGIAVSFEKLRCSWGSRASNPVLFGIATSLQRIKNPAAAGIVGQVLRHGLIGPAVPLFLGECRLPGSGWLGSEVVLALEAWPLQARCIVKRLAFFAAIVSASLIRGPDGGNEARSALLFSGLGYLPGGEGDSWARSVSADGLVVVGWSKNASGQYEAFHWTAAER